MLYCDFDVIDTVIKMCVKRGGQYHDSITSLKFPLLGDSRVWFGWTHVYLMSSIFLENRKLDFPDAFSGMGFSKKVLKAQFQYSKLKE